MSVYSQLGLHTHAAKTHVHTSTCAHPRPGASCANQPFFSAIALPTGRVLLGTVLVPDHPLLVSPLPAACVEVHLFLGASLGNNVWVFQAGTGELWRW